MGATATNSRSIDLVRRFNDDVFNGRDYDRAGEYQAENYVQHGPWTGVDLHGSGEAMETLRGFHTAFPDLNGTVEFAFSDDDDRFVCSVYTYRGTHDGEFMGLAPTGIECKVRGVTINRIEDDRIVESWPQVDMLGLMQQLGVAPSMDDPAA